MTVTAHKLDQRMPVDAVPVEIGRPGSQPRTPCWSACSQTSDASGILQRPGARIAHPINNLLTQTQVSLAQSRDADTYQDILASNAEEFQRLARMVSDMLFLAKTEHGIELPNREDVALEEEARAFWISTMRSPTKRTSPSGGWERVAWWVID